MEGLARELRAAAPQPLTVAQLAERFGVSERTVHRDLAALQQAGVPLWSSPGPGGGFHLDPIASLPPISFSEAEALAVVLALSSAGGGPVAEAARAALDKTLDVLSPEGARAARQRVGRPRRADRTKRRLRVEEAVQQAVLERRVVELSYVDRDGVTARRLVEPYGFVAVGGDWYLIGWCRQRHGGRGFRLDRIAQAALTDEVAPNRDLEDLGADPTPSGPRLLQDGTARA